MADISGIISWNPDEDEWELYNLAEDFSQANDLAAEMPEKLQAMKDTFTMQAAVNKDFPIGGGLYMMAHPEEMRAATLTEWNLYPGQKRIPESMAPKFMSGFSSLSTIEADVPENASGVLFAVGGIAGGFTVYMDEGYLRAEYNAITLNRYKIASEAPIRIGDVTIEVEFAYDAREREAGATVTFRVNGAQVGQGRVERSVPAGFTASETFDVGVDLGSPVALDYSDRAPFEFNGDIRKINIKYM